MFLKLRQLYKDTDNILFYVNDDELKLDDVVENKPCIHRYNRGILTSSNVYNQRKEILDSNLAISTKYDYKEERPAYVTELEIPCSSCFGKYPGSIKKLTWKCAYCDKSWYFNSKTSSKTSFVYCECGSSELEDMEFICNDPLHTSGNEKYDNDKMSKYIRQMEKDIRYRQINTVIQLTGHTNTVHSLAVLQNGNLASGAWDNSIKIWNTVENKLIATLKGHTGWIYCLTVLQNGCLASGSQDKTIKIWNTVEKKLIATLKGHTGWIYFLAVLQNGFLASGSGDATIRIWNTLEKKLIITLKVHRHNVMALAVLPNGYLASGSGDKSINILNIVESKLN